MLKEHYINPHKNETQGTFKVQQKSIRKLKVFTTLLFLKLNFHVSTVILF